MLDQLSIIIAGNKTDAQMFLGRTISNNSVSPTPPKL